MRTLAIVGLIASGLLAATPAAAQVSSPGPVFYNSSPGTPNAPPIPAPSGPVYDPGGPTWHNQSGAVPPGAPTVYDPAGPAFYNQPGAPTAGAPVYYNTPRAMPSASRQQYGGGRRGGGRWGGAVNGRWWGGAQAPGGWGSYRRPSRGFTLPGYWMSSNFRIPDYGSFGLGAPGRGYYWARYYDDAVLVDGRGRVWDSVSGVAWADADADAGYGSAYASSQAYASAGGGQRGIAQVDPNQYYSHTPGGYPPSAVGGPPTVQYQCQQACPGVSYGNGYYNGGGSYYGGGGYYGGTTTTVMIQSAPVITTTIIEEVVEEEVVTTTYVSKPRRAVRRAPVRYRPKPRPAPRQCGCQCVCR